ncbi:aspartyl-phosphate phosphatase Spo0E family protein [Lederbergia citri]|nr:aspartyl-phosphate phosphatase Spo0E family protein [Lederbergia citri]
MQKNRTGAVPFELPSTDVSNEVLSNLETIPDNNKHKQGKKEQGIKKQSQSFCLNNEVNREVSKCVAGENIDVNAKCFKDKIKKILEMKIIKVREEMITIGVAKGLNSPETVNLSQELDSLLNQYYQLK